MISFSDPISNFQRKSCVECVSVIGRKCKQSADIFLAIHVLIYTVQFIGMRTLNMNDLIWSNEIRLNSNCTIDETRLDNHAYFL